MPEQDAQNDLNTRKAAELQSKAGSLTREFDDWLAQSKANGPLEKHHTQIRRVLGQLGGLEQGIQARLTALQQSPAAPSEYAALERRILEVHRLWEFFRAKLMVRRVERFQEYLAVADELAWECYRAGQEAWTQATNPPTGANREPPLLFFNGSISPFIQPRNLAFAAEQVPNEALSTPEVVAMVKKLPLPVIGIPWSQIRHLPEVLFVGHEVGHSLEDDFGLTDTITALVKGTGIPAERLNAWHAWQGEIFADVYGTLATGPAFVGALSDRLAGDSTIITGQTAGPRNVYPTRYLRVLLAHGILEKQGHEEESATRLSAWKAMYPVHAMTAFEDDVPLIVGALLDGPYPNLGGRRLDEILSFSPNDHAAARNAASDLLKDFNPSRRDVRLVLAAARLAFEQNPQKYSQPAPTPPPGATTRKDVHERVVAWVLVNQKVGVRSSTRRAAPELMQELDTADRAAGIELFETLNRRPDARSDFTAV